MFNTILQKSKNGKGILKWTAVLVFLILLQNASTIKVAKADLEPPIILPRSTWENTQELKNLLYWVPDRKNTSPPDYAKVERIVVHDTGCPPTSTTCNSDDTDQISVIQNMYRSHTIFRGWGDVGYNYIIDRKGNIYEGKFGGNGVRGAHTYYDRKCINFNVGTAGIVLLGNYSQQDMPEAMYQSLEKLVAWIGANNNIDPADLKRTTPVWYNPKNKNGKCDTSEGSFGTAFTGPALVGHGDVEAGNPDPGLVNLATVREKAKSFYDAYKKNVYQVAGTNQFWDIENGERTSFANGEELARAGYSNYTLETISSPQLEFYPLHSSFKYPDGTLVRGKDLQIVYVIEEGKRRPLDLTADEFIKLGFKWDQVVILINKDMILYPEGDPVKFAAPEGELVTDSSGKIYRLESGRKRWITSLSLFLALGYQWDKVKSVSSSALNSWLEGSWMTYPDNTLVKGSDGKVYLVSGQQKHAVASLQLFDRLKFKWSEVRTIVDSEIDAIKEGTLLTYPDGSLIKTSGNPDVYFIQDNKKHLISSDTLLKKLGYQPNNVLTIGEEEMSVLATGDPAKYPNGSLLQAKGYAEVYLVEKEYLRWIKTQAEFKKKGYRSNQVVAIKPAELAFYSIKGDIPRSFTLLPSPSATSVPVSVPAPAATPATPAASVTPASSSAADQTSIYSGKTITVTSSWLRIRSTWSTKGKILGQIKYKETYAVLDEKNGWYKIKTSSDLTGWVSGEYVRVSAPSAPAIAAPPPSSPVSVPSSDTITITSDWLRIRSLPTTKSSILGLVNYGEVYQTIEKSNGWYKIQTPKGLIGWVSGDYVSVGGSLASAPVDPTPVPIVNSSNSNDNVASSYSSTLMPTMRVAIYSPSSSDTVKVTANGSFTLKKYNSANILTESSVKNKDEIASTYYSQEYYWRFEPSSKNTIMKVVSYDDIMSWNTTLNDNEYRGIIEVKYSSVSNKVWVINELPLEDYVDGIGEASNGDYSEYLKAFSLAARTYAQYYIEKGGKYKGEPFYLKNSRNGNGNDQLYRGYGFEKRAPNIVSANSATRGQIITFNSKTIVAAYSSDSGGVTKDACVVLTSAYCNDSNFSYLKGGISDPPATLHNPASVAASHGAGISAVGARQMAKEGKNYQDILKTYYPGVAITTKY